MNTLKGSSLQPLISKPPDLKVCARTASVRKVAQCDSEGMNVYVNEERKGRKGRMLVPKIPKFPFLNARVP